MNLPSREAIELKKKEEDEKSKTFFIFKGK